MSNNLSRFIAVLVAVASIVAAGAELLRLFPLGPPDSGPRPVLPVSAEGPASAPSDTVQPAPARAGAVIGQNAVAANYCSVSPPPQSTAPTWHCSLDGGGDVGQSCGCPAPAGQTGGMLLANRLGTAVRLDPGDLATHCQPKSAGADRAPVHDLPALQLKGTACRWGPLAEDAGVAM